MSVPSRSCHPRAHATRASATGHRPRAGTAPRNPPDAASLRGEALAMPQLSLSTHARRSRRVPLSWRALNGVHTLTRAGHAPCLD